MFVGVNPSVGGGELQFLNAASQPVAVIEPGGNVGIGTTTPGAMLEVHGNVLLSAAGATITFADGTPQSTAWTGVLCGGDYAESVGMSDDRTHYESGDLIVVDADSPGKFLKSVEPYSTLVAGIYSTKPGVVGRRTTDAAAAKEEIPMASGRRMEPAHQPKQNHHRMEIHTQTSQEKAQVQIRAVEILAVALPGAGKAAL